MKRANELEAAASKLNAHLPPVSTQAVQTRRGMLPRIRAEHRESVFLCLPDELFREIGKHLPLEQWIALRQLCKVLNEQVDRQPLFILLRLAQIRHGLSVAELAEKAGIDRNTLTALELGRP